MIPNQSTLTNLLRFRISAQVDPYYTEHLIFNFFSPFFSLIFLAKVSPPSVQFTVNKPKHKPASLLKLVQEETNAMPRKDHQLQEETGDQRSESKYFMRPKAVSMETKRRLTENPVRFTLALAEINRRILSQQLMWFNL